MKLFSCDHMDQLNASITRLNQEYWEKQIHYWMDGVNPVHNMTHPTSDSPMCARLFEPLGLSAFSIPSLILSFKEGFPNRQYLLLVVLSSTKERTPGGLILICLEYLFYIMVLYYGQSKQQMLIYIYILPFKSLGSKKRNFFVH